MSLAEPNTNALAAQTKRFTELALPHREAVSSMALRLCENDVEADDLVQEVYLRAFDAFDRFDLRPHGARPWLLKILYNVFFNERERSRRRPATLDDAYFDDFFEEPGASFETEDDSQALRWDNIDGELKAAVDRLPSEYRAVLLFWAVEELSYKEIAEVCGCPIGTVMSRLHRARQLLIHDLSDYAARNNWTVPK